MNSLIKSLSIFFTFFCGISLLSEDQDFAELSIEELANITITGSTLTEDDLTTVPASVTVFTREDIQHMGLDYLHELMNFVPGFQSYRQAEGAQHYSYSSRGRKLGASGRDLLILVDGIRTDAPWTSGTVYTIPNFPLNNIKRVEFIRGPGSSIYGSNAFLGMVNVITDKDLNEIELNAGTHNKLGPHVMFAEEYSQLKISAYLQAYSDQGDSFAVPDSFSLNKVNTHDPQKGLNSQLFIQWADFSFQGIRYERKSSDFYIVELQDNELNQSDRSYTALSLKYDYDATDNFSGNLKMGYRFNETDLSSRLSPIALADIELFEQEIWFNWFNNWLITNTFSLQFGVEYRKPELREIDFIVNKVVSIPAASELLSQDIFGYFVQVRHDIFAHTSYTLGLRYDSVAAIGSQVSPRLSLIHHINNQHTLKLLYSEAFRSPSFIELLATTGVYTGNPNLEPENIRSWEVVWMYHDSDKLINISYFENIFEDSIIQHVDVNNGKRYENSDSDEKSRGIEFEFHKTLNKHWSLRSGYTHFLHKPVSAFRESEFMVFAMLNCQFKKWNVNVSANYLSDKRRIIASGGQSTLDGFWNVNGKVSYRISDVLKAYIQIKNIFHEQHLTPAQGTLNGGIPSRGMEATIGVNWNF